MKKTALSLISFYQRFISIMFPRACRFYPSCSEYARIAIEKYGLFKGAGLALKRVGKCHPFHAGGFDPVD